MQNKLQFFTIYNAEEICNVICYVICNEGGRRKIRGDL